MKLLLFIAGLLFALACHAEERPTLGMRCYPATVAEITDGDTVKLNIDLGFGVSMNRVPIRLAGVFAPERGKPGAAEATARLKELMPPGDPVLLRPVMSIVGREQMSFARYVGRVWHHGTDVCAAMERHLSESTKE